MRLMTALVISGLALAGVLKLIAGNSPDTPIVDPSIAARGAKVSNKCIACHALDSRENGVGPHLVGIMGRTAGGIDGYRYSDAMKSSKVVWDASTLKQFLMGPQQFIAGTNMGISPLTEGEADELVTYLEGMQ